MEESSGALRPTRPLRRTGLHVSGHSDPELAQILSQLEGRVSQRLVRLLASTDSSLKEWRLLSSLAVRSGRTMTEIAEIAILPAPTATKLIDTMVADNLVYRRSDDTDRRRILIFLAPRGWKKYERLLPLVAEEQAELSSFADENELRELVRLLTQFMDRVG